MIKKVLIAAAMMIATPGILFSQDIFWSFDNNAITTSSNVAVGSSGSAYLFASETYAFDGATLDFTSSDTSVFVLTGGQAFDDPFNTVGGMRWDLFSPGVVSIGSPGLGSFFGVSSFEHGISPALGPLFDPNFVPGVGHLLAQVDYDRIGGGPATLDLALGNTFFTQNNGAVFSHPGPEVGNSITIVLDPSLGSGSFTTVPEPSSAMLLILGSVGLVARRRKTTKA